MCPAPTNSEVKPACCNPALPAGRVVSLTQLQAGQHGVVQSLDELKCEDCDLLRAMGMTDRCTFRVCQAGEPWIVQVESTRIGLSRRIADRLRVMVLGEQHTGTPSA